MKWLKRCLESTKPFHLVIVDNNSSDGTVKFIEKYYPEAILMRQNDNLGFGQANNIGISMALSLGADFVFLMNQDVFLENQGISKLLAVHKNYPEYGILSPIHLNGSGDLLDKDFAKFSLSNNKIFRDALLNDEIEDPVYEVPFINAAAWLIPKKCLYKVGGFDPVFYHYGEDENYCQRVIYHGFKIGVFSKSHIFHDSMDIKSLPKKKFSKQYYRAYKKFIFVKFGNINTNFHSKFYKREQINIKKKLIKSLLRLNIPNYLGYLKQLKFLHLFEAEIKRSRIRNSIPGKHYLS